MPKYQEISTDGVKVTFKVLCDNGHEETQTYLIDPENNGATKEERMSAVANHINDQVMATVVAPDAPVAQAPVAPPVEALTVDQINALVAQREAERQAQIDAAKQAALDAAKAAELNTPPVADAPQA